MITVKSSPFKFVWFGKNVSYKKYPFEEFVHTKAKGIKPGFIKTKKYTKIINLNVTAEELLKSFNKDTRYKVNRAIRENCQLKIGDSIEEFTDFYNVFAQQKGRAPLPASIRKWAPYLVITQVSQNDEMLTMHSYIIDPNEKRARLENSASHFRKDENKENRALIGRANKFLHYKSMLYFKEQGIEMYDFGGYAYGTKDPVLAGINRFKDSFKGELIEENIYTPLPLFIAKKILGKS